MEGCGLGHVGDVVRDHDLGQVLAVLLLALLDRTRGRGRGVGAQGRRARTLDPGVHVCLVVVADVEHVVTAFHRSGQGLQTDVVGATVTAEGDEVHVVPFDRQIAVFLERAEGSLHAADRGGAVFEGSVDERGFPGRVGEDGGDHFHTPGRPADHRVDARGQHDLLEDVRPRASRAGAVSPGQEVFVSCQLFEISCHGDASFPRT